MTLPVKIYKCTLEILIRSKMWKIQLFCWLEKWNLYYFSIASYTQGKSLSKRTCKLNKEIKETKTWIFNSDSSDKGFKGTVVHRASPSLHLGSLAIKLTVHLKKMACLIHNGTIIRVLMWKISSFFKLLLFLKQKCPSHLI